MQTRSISNGDYLPSDSETFLLKLLRMFRPGDDKLASGNSHWLTCRSLLEFEGKCFSLDDLEKTVNQDSTLDKKQVLREEISTVLETLKENGFLNADTNGFKLVLPEAAVALNEFFGFDAKPGTGKIGFEKYLAKSQKRLMMWYCLHEPKAFTAEKSAKITGYSEKKCKEFLERFRRNKWLKTKHVPGTYTSSASEKNTIFQKLLTKYKAYRSSVLSMTDFINVVLQRYEEVSRKIVREDLEEEGIDCDRKTVYNHMKTFENEGVLKEKGELKEGRGAHQKLYAVKLCYSGKYGEELIVSIKKRIERSSFRVSKKKRALVSDNFYKYASEQKPTDLMNFWQNLRWGLVLRSASQTSTQPLWLKLQEELYPDVLNPMFQEISNVSLEDPDEKLKAISKKYKMSPLITSILYYSLCKFPKGTDTRKNQEQRKQLNKGVRQKAVSRKGSFG